MESGHSHQSEPDAVGKKRLNPPDLEQQLQEARLFYVKEPVQRALDKAALKANCLLDYLAGDKRTVTLIHAHFARILACPEDPQLREPMPVFECEPPKSANSKSKK